jgi:hypothetical protein
MPDGVAWEMVYDAESQLLEVIENADQSAANKTTLTYDMWDRRNAYSETIE